MPVTLISTAGAPNANSYANVAEANAYNDGHMDGAAWAELEMPVKNRALVHATRLLDENANWIGERATEAQALEWPRAWALNRSGTFYSELDIPLQVKYATADLARRLATGNAPTTSGTSGTENLKSLKAGPVELHFKEDAITTATGVPDDVLQMVRFLTTGAKGDEIRSVPVLRV